MRICEARWSRPTRRCLIRNGFFLWGLVRLPAAFSDKPLHLLEAWGRCFPSISEVPGDPPPPLSILHGLLVVTGRKHLSDSLVQEVSK